jgi:hypothetical protein
VTDQAAIIDSRENLSSYALLGMSSDDLSKAGLSPNYDVPWKELLQQLVKFLLCEQVSVETWDNREIAIIKSKGGVIGLVSSVEKSWDDRQNVGIITPEHLGSLDSPSLSKTRPEGRPCLLFTRSFKTHNYPAT